MKMNLLVLASLLAMTGCTHTVKYKLAEQDRWTGPKISKTVAVETFADSTTPETRKDFKIDKTKWRTNYRSRYANSNLTAGVSTMIAKHLAHSGLFANVSTGPTTNADCVLSGTLAEYSSMGRVNSGAETTGAVSAGFGAIGYLLGAAATSGSKTEIRVSVKMDDLKLTGKSGEVLWQDSISIRTNFPAHFQAADTSAVFTHSDNALKSIVTEMIRRIGNTLATNQVRASQ
ncbi:MAG: hypothetical protein HZA90_21040 [Verrucomicrobia bacterium]|nr:hypothetical protein [Verrucomicrobiota bacterium]